MTAPARLSLEEWITAITGSPLREFGADQVCTFTPEQLRWFEATFPGAAYAACPTDDPAQVSLYIIGDFPHDEDDGIDAGEIDPEKWDL